MGKKVMILLMGVLFTLCTDAFALNADNKDVIASASKSFRTGDAVLLAENFYQTIEMELLGDENFYSKEQATLLMKNFFSNNPPKSFVVAHEGFKDSTAFAIGTLKTATSIFRVSIFIKTDQGKSYIHQLRIEKNS